MEEVFTNNFYLLCDKLAAKDEDLKQIILRFGYPPLWTREPNFETMIHFILEQQVSLASALAALNKLKILAGKITPEKVLTLTDAELKACYFSRQKITYARSLANAVVNEHLSISGLAFDTDDVVRARLKKVKGIGDWTVDVFLMMSLHRCNCFPTGDIALLNSTRHIKNLPKHTTREEILLVAKSWEPYTTIAAYLLWHAYIETKRLNTRVSKSKADNKDAQVIDPREQPD